MSQAQTIQRIFFVGLGQMGFHLTQHVATRSKEFEIPVYAFDQSEIARQRIDGATGITTTSHLNHKLSANDVLCLSVPDGKSVRSIVESLGSLEDARGLLIMDFSSVSPSDAREISAELVDFGIRYVDCPVTGGVLGAELGTLTTIVGSSHDSLKHAEWIIDSFSSRIVFAEKIGFGALLKSLNNMIGNIAAIASMEGIIVAKRAGISDEVLLEVLNNGTALTYFSLIRYPKYVATKQFNAGMRVGLVNKDLQIAIDAAAELDCDLIFCSTGQKMWLEALAKLGPDADTTLMMDVVTQNTTGHDIYELFGE